MSKTLPELIRGKSQRMTLGLMSGTSADGLDIAYCAADARDPFLRNLASETIPYPDSLREKILDIARDGNVALKELIALSTYLGHFYADAIEQFCVRHRIPIGNIELIGTHGQTVAHLAKPVSFLDRAVTGTLQIGEAEIIAKRIGVVTVSDFRSGDTALGGSGAPLAPIYHRAMLGRLCKDGVIVNIGGIANITVLKENEECLASDTGPGNCLIDTVIWERSGLRFDEGGMLAQKGKVDDGLVREFLDAELLQRTPPVSHDRGEIVQLLKNQSIAKRLSGLSTESALATLVELSAITIRRTFEQLRGGTIPEVILVCGGGAHNKFLMRRLRDQFAKAKVIQPTSSFGLEVDFVEAEAFAYLANLTLEFMSGNLPQVTGASRAAILGKISLP